MTMTTKPIFNIIAKKRSHPDNFGVDKVYLDLNNEYANNGITSDIIQYLTKMADLPSRN